MTKQSAKRTKVLYDGSCPLCRREISFYKRQKGANEVSWVDVSCSTKSQFAPGVSRDQALARFHVITPEGEAVTGGDAFAHLWTSLSGFHWLGNLFRAKPFRWVLNRLYDIFLYLRPLLQTIVESIEFSRSCKKRRP